MQTSLNRRSFFVLVTGALAFFNRLVLGADEKNMLSVKDPVASALGYVEDASKAAGRKGDATCANCMQYASTSADAGKCNLFPGKLVKAKGWCRSWAKKV